MIVPQPQEPPFPSESGTFWALLIGVAVSGAWSSPVRIVCIPGTFRLSMLFWDFDKVSTFTSPTHGAPTPCISIFKMFHWKLS